MRTVFSRVLIPVAVALAVLPVLLCVVFYQCANQYAYSQAQKELAALQEQIAPLLKDNLAEESASIEGETGESTSSFLFSAGVTASQLGGNARLLVLSQQMRVVYPRNEQQRANVQPLARLFSERLAGQDASAISDDGTFVLDAGDSGMYLACVYNAPANAQPLRYVITYCPTSSIGEWVGRATIYVFLIALALAIVAFAALWFATRRITRPMQRLCEEAGRIGEGDFSPIEPHLNVTELEQLRCAMNDMSARLAYAEDTQKRFFQNVSHELRSPLMSIGGYAQGIEMGVFNPPNQAARIIQEESMRLGGAVDGLLTLSRLDCTKEAQELHDIDAHAVAHECVARMRGAADAAGIAIQFDSDGQSVVVQGSEELFSKVMDNLLSNAVRYAKNTVTVRVFADQGGVTVVVADDGPGIASEDLPHVFERCYKGKGGQFGIGLAVAQTAAHLMGAALDAANAAGGGAVFTMRFF